jgi:hypothetical protein
VIILLVGATIVLSLMAFLRDRYPWIRAIFEVCLERILSQRFA